jgi:dihydrodipicolinate synthase/N-acetylneuraminate lyase
VPLSLDLGTQGAAFPDQFAGIKDSSGDPEHARALGQRFGADLLVLTGNDSVYPLALQNHAGGCITAMQTCSPDLRLVWDAHIQGNRDHAAEARLDKARQILAKYPPNPPLYKALLARMHRFPLWNVRSPLLCMSPESLEAALASMPGSAEFSQ